MTIAEKVKAYINEKGIKQIAICRSTGISTAAMSETLLGNRTMTAEEFAAICRFLEVSPETFID